MRKNCEMERILSLISLFLFYVALVVVHMISFSLGHPLICTSHDSRALLQFKQSLVVADYPWCDDKFFYDYEQFHCGSSYPKTTSWNRSTDCCSWDGITCDRYSGHVIGLDLSNSKLEGTIHPNSSLFQLPHLQILDLSVNNFPASQIPQGIGHLVSLKYLNLSYSFLQGRIPSEISYLSNLVSLDLSDSNSLQFSEEGLDMLFHNLTKLEVLSLSSVDISSKIPMNISSSSLRYLDLGGTYLQGDLPQSIFLLPNLETLRLRGNYLTISLPKFNWSSSHSLTELDLSFNNIFGGLPGSLGSLKSLKIAELYKCNLVGPIPESIRNLSQITQLNLWYNHLEGEIPDVFSNLQKLTRLELGINAFIGPFPASLVNSTKLEYLSLGDNLLSGPLPLTANGLQNLRTLFLGDNSLNGSIPSWMFSLPSLINLDLSRNHFSGPLPEFKTNSLESLVLSQNELHGPIPQSLRDLVNLTDLLLGQNKLSGEVGADKFSSMKDLYHLDLSSSGLSWSSSKDNINITFPHLNYLRLGFCGVKDFPNFLLSSKELAILDLSGNEIQGQFPQWFGGLSSLRHLNLSHNNLTSLDHVPCKSMDVVDLQSNSLTGPLPSSLCTSCQLGFLDLSNNSLSAEIPNCLFTSTRLKVLDLRANNFHGPIPNNFPNNSGLVHVSLSKNQLEGPIPRSLINCTSLRFLDLGNNKICDTFPTLIEMLPNLEILILKSNRFYGHIGGSRKKSPILKLRIFDISGNSFTGSLPTEIFKGFKAMMIVDGHKSKLEYMEEFLNNSRSYEESVGLVMKNQQIELKKINMMLTSIDLSRNKFEGEIPEFIGNLNSLMLLNLSHNSLTGHIPVEIKNMSWLEALDLSFNQLIGRIPGELTSLTFLAVLNLSYNHLVGPIPRSDQFITFSNDSYVGNPGLCGFPLSNECGHKSAPSAPPLVEQEGDEPSFASEITLSSVLIGYGCGLVFGLTTLYFIYRYERPRWFIVFFASITPGNPYRAKRRGQRRQNFRRRGH